MPLGEALFHALNMTLIMAWEIFWALVVGFTLSAVTKAVVSKGEMSRLLPQTGGPEMLAHMEAPAEDGHACHTHGHSHHHYHG